MDKNMSDHIDLFMERMTELGLRQVDIADHLEIPPGTVSVWFNKRSYPSGAILIRLLDYLKLAIIDGSIVKLNEHGLKVNNYVQVKLLTFEQAANITKNTFSHCDEFIQVEKQHVKSNSSFAIKMLGDTMKCVGHKLSIAHNDILICDYSKERSPKIGDLVITRINNAACVRIYAGDHQNPLFTVLNLSYTQYSGMTTSANAATVIATVHSVQPAIKKLID
ncbi:MULTISPECIES: LexA family transcriptional regulator [Cysteiniphilum]|uniref:LexA family transcriptional regulator n=1 Tax=Cysteiniphilum TaxID=2056696 RepID=UPI001784E25A|nr:MULTISPECIES: helix-turn-helix transcriptional regulator [Cysteiniphilum]